MSEKIKVKVKRYDPSSGQNPYMQEYDVPLEDGMSIANVLRWITDNLDPTLAFYISCRIGKCKGCLVKVNGKGKYACTEPVAGNITLEPVNEKKVIRDLVCDSEVSVPV